MAIQARARLEEAALPIADDPAPAHPAFAVSAAHLSQLLHGLVSRWETLDFTINPACFALETRLQAWRDADAAQLPRAYERS